MKSKLEIIINGAIKATLAIGIIAIIILLIIFCANGKIKQEYLFEVLGPTLAAAIALTGVRVGANGGSKGVPSPRGPVGPITGAKTP